MLTTFILMGGRFYYLWEETIRNTEYRDKKKRIRRFIPYPSTKLKGIDEK